MRFAAVVKLEVCLALALAFVPGIARAQLSLAIYGDVDYAIERRATTQHTFLVPAFDVFATANQDRWSFLGELLFEFPEGNALDTDLERAEIGYLVADWLRLRAGRFHSAIGYYNDAYHHGALFETATGRPSLHAFEDEGGLLPAHLVGVHASGQIGAGSVGSFAYDVEVANGRGHSSHEITNVLDTNFGKALGLRLRYEPGFAPDLLVGGNLYLDQIPSTDSRPGMTEQIVAGHIAYTRTLQLLAEVAQIQHQAEGTGERFSTLAGYGEASYTFGSVTPYLRFEQILAPSVADPFYAVSGEPMGDSQRVRVGAKWLPDERVAIKLEGQREWSDHGPVNRLVLQAAFGFGTDT